MKKKMLSTIISAFICAGSLIPVSSNAVFLYFNEEYLAGYELVEDNNIFYTYGYSGDMWENYEFPEYQLYLKENSDDESKAELLKVSDLGIKIPFQISPDSSPEKVKEVLSEYVDLERGFFEIYEDESGDFIQALLITHYSDNITEKDIRNIFDDLSENVNLLAFSYSGFLQAEFINCNFLYPKEEQIIEAFKAYVNENENTELIETDTKITIAPKGESTLNEKFAVIADMTEKYDIHPRASSYEAFNTLDTVEIDVLNAIDGDSNNDGSMNMADAVLIMQSIANPDSYALSGQGSFNADVNATGDGITMKDALVIQERLLGL